MHICKQCGSNFEPRVHKTHQVFCTKDCYREASKGRGMRNYHAKHAHYRARHIAWGNDRKLNQPWITPIESARARASKRRLPCDLTFEWGARVWTGFCSVSKIPFIVLPRQTGGQRLGPAPYAPSIDKIIPEKGYVESNCRFVLTAVNFLKHTATDADMYRIAEAIINNRSFT